MFGGFAPPSTGMPHLSWFLKIFRRVLSETSVLRRSFRSILFLWAILRRHFTKRGYPASSSDSTRVSIRASKPSHCDTSDSQPICASLIPSQLRVQYTTPSLELQESPTSIYSAVPLHTPFPLPNPDQSSCTVRDLAIPTSYLDQYPLDDYPRIPARLPPISERHPVLEEIDISSLEIPINSFDDDCDRATPAGLCPQELQLVNTTPRCRPEPTSSSMIQDFGRYQRNVVVPRIDSEFMVPSLTTHFIRENVPRDWLAITHPEGNLYFYHRDKRIFTDAYLCEEKVLSYINAVIRQLEDEITAKNISLLPTWECVLELSSHNDEFECGYYFVDHHSRCLLWLEDFDISHIITDVKGLTSPSHIKHEMEAQYWIHWELFPNFRIVTHDIVDELRQILLHASADCLTSHLSTIPYSSEDLNKMLSLVDRMKVTSDKQLDTFLSVEECYSHSACVIGRFMATFTHHKFLHFYGQHGARLSRDQSVHTDASATPQRSLLIKLLSPALFSAPDVHLRALETIWIDETVSDIPWIEFIAKLNIDWQEYILFSTVLLNANVAFLGIGSVDQKNAGGVDQRTTFTRSPAQIASYLSVACSVGSIILGLLLVRQNRTKDRSTAISASDFLKKWSQPSLGLETLAIMYGLPYALLMWGMVSFLVAFSFMWFQQSDNIARWLVGGPSFAIAVLIIWCIWTSWESEERYWWSWYTHITSFYSAATVEGEHPSRWPQFVRRRRDSDQTIC